MTGTMRLHPSPTLTRYTLFMYTIFILRTDSFSVKVDSKRKKITLNILVCFGCFTSQSINFQSYWDDILSSWKQRIDFLAQGHYTVTPPSMSLKPATIRIQRLTIYRLSHCTLQHIQFMPIAIRLTMMR